MAAGAAQFRPATVALPAGARVKIVSGHRGGKIQESRFRNWQKGEKRQAWQAKKFG
jgi:hypothetical protein